MISAGILQSNDQDGDLRHTCVIILFCIVTLQRVVTIRQEPVQTFISKSDGTWS